MKSTRNRILTIGAAVMLAVARLPRVGTVMRTRRFHHMLKQLDLTSDQQSQVKAISKKRSLHEAADGADASEPRSHENA